jgi:hypothetical protein
MLNGGVNALAAQDIEIESEYRRRKGRRLAPTQQLRQLGEVARQPPRLVHGEHARGVRVIIVLACMEVGERNFWYDPAASLQARK